MKVLLALPIALCCFLLQTGNYAPVENKIYTTPIALPADNELFGSDEVLEIKLSGKIKALFADRADDGAYHPLVLTYKGPDGSDVTINLRGKTREGGEN